MTTDWAERLPTDFAFAECREAWRMADAPQPPAAAGSALLTLQQVQLRQPGRSGASIGPFNLALQAGEHVAILGPSGAGKSTLLKLMAGERPPQQGELRFDGRTLAGWSPAALARRRAVLPQSHAVAFSLPVALVVGLGRVALDHDPALASVTGEALALAHAGHLTTRRFDTLSGGEQARVQLARVFAQLWDAQAGLLLVDEPLASLDPGLQFELLDAMQAFCRTRGHALVAVLHDINQALAGFERLWLLQQGRLMGDLPPNASALAPLENLYGIQLRSVPGEDGRLAVLARRRVA